MKLAVLLDRLELLVSNLCLAGLVLVLGLQVFFRYGLEVGLSWSEEVSRFLFIWFVYVSGSLAVRKGTHVRVTLFVDLLTDRYRPWLQIAADLVWAGFNSIVVISGIMLLQRMFAHPVYSTSLFLPLAWIYMVIPLAHGLMVLHILQRLGRPWEGETWSAPDSAAGSSGGAPDGRA